MRAILLALALFLPASALAAPATPTFSAARDLIVTSATAGNSYDAAGTLAISTPTAGDLSALAGSMFIGAPISGDALLAGGVVTLHAAVQGDLRALGGHVSVAAPVSGDEVIFGGAVEDTAGGAHTTFIIAANATLSAGAKGPVTIYANNVSLDGTFAGDVRIIAAGHVTIAPDTIIRGTLKYQSPEAANIATSTLVRGGITYTSASYLPSSGEAHVLAIAAVGIFLFVRILGALMLAGLCAGLFPLLADAVAEETGARSVRGTLLTLLLGFALLVATPVLLLLLALTFVGLWLALVLGISYVLLLALAFVYTGIIVGGLLARRIYKRENIYWRDAIVGMFIVCLITTLPYVGLIFLCLLVALAEGALARIFYRFSFPHEVDTERLL